MVRIQHQRTAVEAPLRIGDELAVRDDGHAIGAQLDDDRLAGALERPLVALPLLPRCGRWWGPSGCGCGCGQRGDDGDVSGCGSKSPARGTPRPCASAAATPRWPSPQSPGIGACGRLRTGSRVDRVAHGAGSRWYVPGGPAPVLARTTCRTGCVRSSPEQASSRRGYGRARPDAIGLGAAGGGDRVVRGGRPVCARAGGAARGAAIDARAAAVSSGRPCAGSRCSPPGSGSRR